MSNQAPFHYVACGLPNVWLQNGVTFRDTQEGEVFHIDQPKELHEAIGLCLVEKKTLLTPEEFRFLRNEMLLSRRSLAEVLGVSPETIKKWEGGAATRSRRRQTSASAASMHGTPTTERCAA